MYNNLNKNKNIKEAIIKVIAFFDLFDYPLTSWEIWKYSNMPRDANGRQGTLMEIKQIMDSGGLNNVAEQKNGFYFLAGRENIIKTRMARYNHSDRKFKRAILVAKIFKFIPWIKMIAVSNIIGAHNLKDESDIDFFIVCDNKRIWITRFFCAGFMKLLGLRPKQGDERDKICLSFYVSEEAMDLYSLTLGVEKQDYGAVAGGATGSFTPPPAGGFVQDDIYFIYWLACLAPIYDRDDTYKKFIQTNSWFKEYLPNWQPVKLAERRNSGKGFSNFYDEVVDLLFGGLERNFKNFQLKKLPNSLKDLMNKDTRVVINDQVLKLHVKDRREEYRKRWQERLVEIELMNWTLR